jgi:hypothetical protein
MGLHRSPAETARLTRRMRTMRVHPMPNIQWDPSMTTGAASLDPRRLPNLG